MPARKKSIKTPIIVIKLTEKEQITQVCKAADTKQLAHAVKSIRQALSSNPTNVHYLNHDLVLKLSECMASYKISRLYSDAAWVLTELAFSPSLCDKTLIYTEAAVAPLVSLLVAPKCPVPRSKVARALGELVRESNKLRDLVFNCGATKLVAELAENTKNKKDRADVINVLFIMCRHPLPREDELDKMWPSLVRILMVDKDADVIREVLWTLNKIMPSCAFANKAMVDAGGVPRLIELITGHNNHKEMSILALQCFNYITRSEDLIQSVIDAQALIFFQCLLAENLPETDKEIIEILLNISFGNEAQIKAVRSCGFIPFLTRAITDLKLKLTNRASAVLAIQGIVSRKSSYATPELVKILCDVIVEDHYVFVEGAINLLKHFIDAANDEDYSQGHKTDDNIKRVISLIRESGYNNIEKAATSHPNKSLCYSANVLLRKIERGY